MSDNPQIQSVDNQSENPTDIPVNPVAKIQETGIDITASVNNINPSSEKIIPPTTDKPIPTQNKATVPTTDTVPELKVIKNKTSKQVTGTTTKMRMIYLSANMWSLSDKSSGIEEKVQKARSSYQAKIAA